MRQIVISLFLFMASFSPLHAQQSDQSGIENTIQSQIDAFINDDFEQAFTYASPTIKSIFGNSDRFGQMVRNGYPMVWRPADIRFLELREVNGAPWQRVMIRDQTGAFHILDYEMLSTEMGWRINGVQLLPAPDIGA